MIYSFRLVNFCLKDFLGFVILNIRESNFKLFPIIFLIIFSILGGSILSWIIFPYFNLIILNLFLKIFVLIICFIGFFLGYFLFNIKFNLNYFYILFIMSFIWFIPYIFSYFFNFYLLKFINFYKIFLDFGWMEFIGGLFFLKFFNFINYFLNYFRFKLYFFLLLIVIFSLFLL